MIRRAQETERLPDAYEETAIGKGLDGVPKRRVSAPAREGGRSVSGRYKWILPLCLLGAFAAAPAGQEAGPIQLSQQPDGIFDSPIERDPAFQQRRLRVLNEARQKSMVADTDRLLSLARELNTEVQAGDSATLTQAQAARIAEIEKLARRVRQKMSESLADGPSVRPPASPLNPY